MTDRMQELCLPSLVSDGMVLQQGEEIKIWGWAEAEKKVIVDFKNKKYKSKANSDGKWSITLPA